MPKVIAPLLGIFSLFLFHAASATSPTRCQPQFNHQDDKVAQYNRCTLIDYQPSAKAGSATIAMNQDLKGSCVYTTAVQCGDQDIRMRDIAAIDFKVNVPAGRCSPTEWIAVYMFPWCGRLGGCWDGGEREVDFVETKGPNGPGGFASNWGDRPKQAGWVNQQGAIRVNNGTKQHITFTSSQVLSGPNNGTYQWDIRVCDATETRCDSSNQLWHAYREKGPTVFDKSMMIVIDNWGVNGPPKKGCTLEITDMVITKHSRSSEE